jgi:hypothetical protein
MNNSLKESVGINKRPDRMGKKKLEKWKMLYFIRGQKTIVVP